MTRVVIRSVLVASVLGIVGAVSIALVQLLLVPSLGAAALLQVSLPALLSAEPWKTAIGQACGVVFGFGAVLVLGASADPSFLGSRIQLRQIVGAVAKLTTAA